MLYQNNETDKTNLNIIHYVCQYSIWSLEGARDITLHCALSVVLKCSKVIYIQITSL